MKNSIPRKGDYAYHVNVGLQQRNKVLERENEALRNGSKMAELKEKHQKTLASRDKRIAKLEKEKRQLEAQMAREVKKAHREWEKVNEEVERECAQQVAAAKRKEEAAWEQAQQAEKAYQKKLEENYEFKTRVATLEEELQARERMLSRNHTNSSLPSSRDPINVDIPNSRERTGNAPGGQPGHPGHRRPDPAPTQMPVTVMAPDFIRNEDDWEFTGEYRTRKRVDAFLQMEVTEFLFPIYQNQRTGEIYKTPLPVDMHNELSYGSNLKAILFFLNHHGNMPIRKVQEFVSEASGGELKVSVGFISGLTKKFVDRSDDEVVDIWRSLLRGPSMNVDTTGVKYGEKGYVTINANDEAAWFSPSKHKGHEAVKGTPLQFYWGAVMQDREMTFTNYGSGRQYCLVHLVRDLLYIIQNEETLWCRFMQGLLYELLEAYKGFGEDGCPEEYREQIEKIYDKIVALGRQEYEYEPPKESFTDGLVLLNAFESKKDGILYFLYNKDVKPHNNDAERLLRPLKRAQSSKMTWRAWTAVENYCHAESVLRTEAMNGRSRFKKMVEVFGRPDPTHALIPA